MTTELIALKKSIVKDAMVAWASPTSDEVRSEDHGESTESEEIRNSEDSSESEESQYGEGSEDSDDSQDSYNSQDSDDNVSTTIKSGVKMMIKCDEKDDEHSLGKFRVYFYVAIILFNS